MSNDRNDPTILQIAIGNADVGDGPIELDELPAAGGMRFDQAVRELMQATMATPEAAFAPTLRHDILLEPADGPARPVTRLDQTLADALRGLEGQLVTIRVSSGAVQAGSRP